jgi:predicted ester cyclase
MRDKKTTMIYNWFQQVWNEGRAEAINDFLSKDIIAHGAKPDGSATHGIEEYKKFYQEFRHNYKDIHVDVKHVICDEVMESGICDVTATFIPTNAKVEFSGLCAVRIENGKAVEAWNQFDFMKMFRQIGFEMTEKQR